jgi:hypothetical protein
MIAVVADEDDASLAREWLRRPADQPVTAAEPTPVTSVQGQVGAEAQATHQLCRLAASFVPPEVLTWLLLRVAAKQ